MRTKTLYHGTKCSDVNVVLNNPLMKQSANGYGLYLTSNIHLARSYGNVVAFEVPYEFEVDVMRPMPHLVDTAFEGAIELVINTQATWVRFMKSIEDAYAEPYATPF